MFFHTLQIHGARASRILGKNSVLLIQCSQPPCEGGKEDQLWPGELKCQSKQDGGQRNVSHG